MKPANNLLPIDDLDRAIVNLSARINAATYELLVLIREFDERAGWLKWGLGNCAEWLHYRCDFSMNASREKVRVAGTRNETELVSFALTTTTARVEERCRELRCGTVDSLDDAQRAFANRSLRVNRDAERGTMTITIELPTETGELVAKAIDKARDDSTPKAEFVDESWSARQADALVSMACRSAPCARFRP